MLARLGGALDAAGRDHGRAYRLGGDEFCALLRGRFAISDELIVAATAALTEHCALVDISAAVGLAVIPEGAATTAEVVHLADQRMYAAEVRAQRHSSLYPPGADAGAG